MTSHQGKTPDLAVIPANAGIQGLKKHVSGCRLAPQGDFLQGAPA
jgi:hypothetical protein